MAFNRGLFQSLFRLQCSGNVDTIWSYLRVWAGDKGSKEGTNVWVSAPRCRSPGLLILTSGYQAAQASRNRDPINTLKDLTWYPLYKDASHEKFILEPSNRKLFASLEKPIVSPFLIIESGNHVSLFTLTTRKLKSQMWSLTIAITVITTSVVFPGPNYFCFSTVMNLWHVYLA